MMPGSATVSDDSYMGMGKNLLFAEFTSSDDWFYEAQVHTQSTVVSETHGPVLIYN